MTLTSTKRLTLEAAELERREGGGERVRLLWIGEVSELLVEQVDIKTGEITLREVPEGESLEVFNHPTRYDEATPAYSYNVTRGEIEIPRIIS